jgi:hypothetical protein
MGAPNSIARMPGGRVSHAPKARRARLEVGLQHGVDGRAEQQIGMADDSGIGCQFGAEAARALRADSLGKLGLANRAERRRAPGAVHHAALDEYGLPHPVGPRVVPQLVQPISTAGTVPEVMVGITDRQVRLEGLLDARGQPSLVCRAISRAAHSSLPLRPTGRAGAPAASASVRAGCAAISRAR